MDQGDVFRVPQIPPEKPLEPQAQAATPRDGSLKKAQDVKSKKSKFKSIFTKSSSRTRSLSPKGATPAAGQSALQNSEPGQGDHVTSKDTPDLSGGVEGPSKMESTPPNVQTPRGDEGKVNAPPKRDKSSNEAAAKNPYLKRGSRRSNSGSRSAPHKCRDGIKKGHYGQMKDKNRELLQYLDELTKNCEYYKSVLKQRDVRKDKEMYEVLKQNESLNLEVVKLEEEITQWREMCYKMEQKSAALTKAKTLTKENKNLVEDIDVLKTVICRLNKELSFYQDRLRLRHRQAPENLPVYSTSSGTEGEEGRRSPQEDGKDWLQSPRRGLMPLLVAYDEVIDEKEEIIRDHEAAIDRFKGRCMEVMKENQDLHKLVSESKERGSISIEEWECLRMNAELVVEENDLLHEQVSNLKKKEELLFTNFQDKSAKSKMIIMQLESESNRLRATVEGLEEKCKKLHEDNLNLSTGMHLRIPKEKHEEMVQQFKQSFEELKSTYQTDRKNLTNKIESVEKERTRLITEVADLEATNARLQGDLKDFEQTLNANLVTMQQIKLQLAEATASKESTSGIIEDFKKHVQLLTTESNAYLEELGEQKALNEQMMMLRNREKELGTELHGKIEAMERLHIGEIKSVQNRVKEVEDVMKSQKEQHCFEICQMHELIKEKDKRIASIEIEKNQLKMDLETVWKTTTQTMQTTLTSRHQRSINDNKS